MTKFSFVTAILISILCILPARADDAPGLGEPGKLQSLELLTGQAKDVPVHIAGKDASRQLIVIGRYDSGQQRDLTRDVQYQTEPAGIVAIDKNGLATPLKEGEAILEISIEDGMDVSSKIVVTNIEQDLPINFANQITPVFTKHGCNGGGCHGKSGGQNGFRLSLLGFEPTEDFEFLVKEGRGRRLFPAAPEKSLLLTKAVGQVPHGGGARFEYNTPPYRVIRRWIEQGMPYGKETDPKVTRIEILPKTMLMQREANQQLTVLAHFSNGTIEDVTRTTQIDSNDPEMASVDPNGLVKTGKFTGSVAVMARYQGHVDVFRATIPLGIQVTDLPKPKNFVDKHVFKNLVSLGLPASAMADDTTFLRRVSIDIAGRLPTKEETLLFLEDTDSEKRAKLIDSLLDSTDYADYFANKWVAILRNKRKKETDKAATFAFHEWVRQSFIENKPYDDFVRDIVTASGELGKNPPVAWYREVKDTATQVEDTAQLFLGLRIQCARCHHHPFEIWSQDDYYSFAAFFSQVSRKNSRVRGQQRIYQRIAKPQARNPKTNRMVEAKGLGEQATTIAPEQDARHVLADWMSKKSNPFFAKALVNRYWKHFFSRGLVDPEDDMRVTNPASNPELLNALAESFVDSDFDLKELVRTICNSKTYQLSAIPNQWNANDKQSFSRYYPKRLNAEVLLDGIDQLTGTQSNFGGIPVGTKAIQLPDNGFNSYFLTVFGRPESSSACECERSGDANLAQSLHLLNSSEIQGKLTAATGTANKMAAEKLRSHQEKIRDLYLTAFSRFPTSQEETIAINYLTKHKADPKRGYEDIVWALMLTKEFLFNH